MSSLFEEQDLPNVKLRDFATRKERRRKRRPEYMTYEDEDSDGIDKDGSDEAQDEFDALELEELIMNVKLAEEVNTQAQTQTHLISVQ